MEINDFDMSNFENYIEQHVEKYRGLSQNDLIKIFGVNSKAKNLNEILICKMFGVKSNLKSSDIFIDSNITPRTIRVLYNGRIKESLPFPAFDYISLINQSWIDSELRREFLNSTFLFFIFKEIKGEYIFYGTKLWKISPELLDKYVKDVWEKTKNVVKTGHIVSYIDSHGVRKTNFPGMKDNYICHVRPHGRDRNDCNILPVMDLETKEMRYTKHAFWINATFLERVVNGEIK